MKIIINDSEIKENFTGSTLGEILDQIHKHHVIRETVLSRILIDGELAEFELESEKGRETRSRDISEIEILEVEIASLP